MSNLIMSDFFGWLLAVTIICIFATLYWVAKSAKPVAVVMLDGRSRWIVSGMIETNEDI